MRWIGIALCAWAAIAGVFSLASALGAARLWRRARRRPAPTTWPAIAILRPCEGDEGALEGKLLSSATARYDGPREVWLLVPSAGDGSRAAAERAKARARELAPSVRVEVLVTEIATPANRKAAQLAVACARLDDRATVIVTADSDVLLDDTSLPALVSALDNERIAAASAPPVEIALGRATSITDRLSSVVLSSSQQSFLALSGMADLGGGIPQIGGALLALRRDALPLLDGFRALEPFLGEDHEMTMRLTAAGLGIATSGAAARCGEPVRSVSEIIRRFGRWALVVRRQRPALFVTYFLLLAPTPLVLAIALAMHTRETLLAAGGLVLARATLALVLRACLGLGANPLWALVAALVAESEIFLGATLALFSTSITWRDRRYTVGPRGVLLPRD